MIKAQTLNDYHNHVIRIINRKINYLNHESGIFFKEYDWKNYYKINDQIKILYSLKQDIEKDWKNSNYSKFKKE